MFFEAFSCWRIFSLFFFWEFTRVRLNEVCMVQDDRKMYVQKSSVYSSIRLRVSVVIPFILDSSLDLSAHTAIDRYIISIAHQPGFHTGWSILWSGFSSLLRYSINTTAHIYLIARKVQPSLSLVDIFRRMFVLEPTTREIAISLSSTPWRGIL